MIEWLASLSDEQKAEAIRSAFSRVAATAEGAIVFAALLEWMYVFRPCTTDAAVALSNFAKEKLLPYMGEDWDIRMTEALIAGARYATHHAPHDEQGAKNGD